MPLIIVSGGQTGVDLAALHAAEQAGIRYTGWVPLHYTNETGEYGIPERFRHALKETTTTASAERTEKNIKDADGVLTLLMDHGNSSEHHSPEMKNSPGTLHGIEYAQNLGKSEEQLCFVNLSGSSDDLIKERDKVLDWLDEHKIIKCAIGGPRESEEPGIQQKAFEFLLDLFQELQRIGQRGQAA